MKRMLLLIIGIVLMLPSSADCQEILLDRGILVAVVSKLDSFDLLKKKEIKYLEFKDSCEALVQDQNKFIHTQEKLLYNRNRQIDFLRQSQQEYKDLLKVNEGIIDIYKKEAKKAKTRTTISLIGGGVLTVGLTTALLITLIQ